MAENFPEILRELDELCQSSKYNRVFSDPNSFLSIVEEAFSTFTTDAGVQTPKIKSEIQIGLAHSLLQKLIGENASSIPVNPVDGDVASKISSQLLTSVIARVREVESDHSLAHVRNSPIIRINCLCL
jgi:hypothetical protein